MRALLALLLTAACATTAGTVPAERVAGCWIQRDGSGGATTMRWLADASSPGALRGEKAVMSGDGGAGAHEVYRLEPNGDAWTLCQIEAAGERCWQVAEGAEGSLEGGRAFIDAHREDLRITIVGDGADRVVFQGARDGCD
jgi:hypothetical protein